MTTHGDVDSRVYSRADREKDMTNIRRSIDAMQRHGVARAVQLATLDAVAQLAGAQRIRVPDDFWTLRYEIKREIERGIDRDREA